MKTESHKNWIDAFRENLFPDEVTPSPGHWESLCRKMYRRKVMRWSMAVAAVLIPLVGLLVFTRSARPAIGPKNVLVMEPNILALDRMEEAPTARVFNPSRHSKSKTITSPTSVLNYDSETIVPEMVAEANNESDDKERIALSSEEIAPIGEELIPEDRRFFELQEHDKNTRGLLIGFNAGLSAAGGRTSYAKQDYLSYVKALMGLETKASINSNSSAVPTGISYRHSFPIETGIFLQVPFSRRLALESGLEYTYLHSVENNNGALSQQKVHLVGIPLRLNVFLFQAGRFDMYAGAGATVEKCVAASLGDIKCDEPDLQWSVGITMGVQYRLGPHISLFLQPSATWYLTETRLITYRSQNPFGFSLQTGLRFNMK